MSACAEALAPERRSFGTRRAPPTAGVCGGAHAPSTAGVCGGAHAPSTANVCGGARALGDEHGQAGLLLLAVLLVLIVGAFVLGGIARGIGVKAEQQRAADLAALAGAKAMHDAYARLFDPERGMTVTTYLDLGRRVAADVGRRNGAADVDVRFPDADSFAPVRIAVDVRRPADVRGKQLTVTAHAEAELAPPSAFAAGPRGAGEYGGPLAYRQGRPMRPDVAHAFDRMSRAARQAGVALIVASGFRSNAEQAALFAAHPDPKWVAPPGTSLHRLGTELDLGPPAAYRWLAANAPRFGFKQRYSWEPWHFGFTRSPGTRSVGYGPADGKSGMPSFVPHRFAPAISRAAQRWNVGAALLAAQLYAESNFNPFARSPAGAQGIAQFMPGTATAYALSDPFDADAAIDAQAHLMHDLLSQFGAVPLALAAYNAGPGPVQRCGCVPDIPETKGYVARILGLLGGAGQAPPGGGLEVRLVR